jgi:hypothetical protein
MKIKNNKMSLLPVRTENFSVRTDYGFTIFEETVARKVQQRESDNK